MATHFSVKNLGGETKTIIFLHSSVYDEPWRWFPCGSIFITRIICNMHVTPLHRYADAYQNVNQLTDIAVAFRKLICSSCLSRSLFFFFFFNLLWNLSKGILRRRHKHPVNNWINTSIWAQAQFLFRETHRETLLCLSSFVSADCYSSPRLIKNQDAKSKHLHLWGKLQMKERTKAGEEKSASIKTRHFNATAEWHYELTD